MHPFVSQILLAIVFHLSNYYSWIVHWKGFLYLRTLSSINLKYSVVNYKYITFISDCLKQENE